MLRPLAVLLPSSCKCLPFTNGCASQQNIHVAEGTFSRAGGVSARVGVSWRDLMHCWQIPQPPFSAHLSLLNAPCASKLPLQVPGSWCHRCCQPFHVLLTPGEGFLPLAVGLQPFPLDCHPHGREGGKLAEQAVGPVLGAQVRGRSIQARHQQPHHPALDAAACLSHLHPPHFSSPSPLPSEDIKAACCMGVPSA